METKYGEYTIRYSEYDEKFVVDVDGSHMTSGSLKSLKKRIDDLHKAEKKFDRIAVLYKKPWGNTLEEGQITSIAESPSYRTTKEVWVVVKGTRSKERLDSLYMDTPENRVIFEEIMGNQKTIEDLKEEISGLYRSMESPELPD